MPGGHAELFAHCYTLYQRAALGVVIYKAIRLLGTQEFRPYPACILIFLCSNSELATHKLEYLCNTWPNDVQSRFLYANVVQLAGHLQNNVVLLAKASILYEECVQRYATHPPAIQAQCYYQAATCYYRTHILSNRGIKKKIASAYPSLTGF